ncbi:MAG: protoporphyrinogen oxidase, partial [Planctomycetes bacterium]|nr:protoporphyrinogen oxidase [Planctomycetota bacterium]
MPNSLPTLPTQSTSTIAVIGGGISGLAAVHRLLELQPRAKVVLLEASNRLGGILRSERCDGFLIEQGADNFITTPPWAIDFCKRIGFDSELIQTNDSHRRAFVVSKGALQPIPAGFAVMAPSRIWPIISTPILSWPGKLRMAAEVFVASREADGSESLAAFVRRRLGREVYDRLVQPLVAGIYTGDPEQLSVGATVPRFLEMEREHGSLIRAMLKQRRQQRKVAQKSSGARYSQFMAPREGMSAFVQAIVDRLGKATLALESPVEQVARTSQGGWEISVGTAGTNRAQPQTLEVDGLILATPARRNPALLNEV